MRDRRSVFTGRLGVTLVLALPLLFLTACTGPRVSTDRHQFTGTVSDAAGTLTLQIATNDGLSCQGTAPPQATDLIIQCSNGLNAELIGVREPGYFDKPVPFRFNNGAIGTATVRSG